MANGSPFLPRLWHDDSSHPRCMGCVACSELANCGGLSIESGVFDCFEFCKCDDPSACDQVCPRHPSRYVARFREVGGFNLTDIPRTRRIAAPRLPLHVVLLYHGSGRVDPFRRSVVAVPLAALIDRETGLLRFESRDDLAGFFGFTPTARLVVSGTDDDPPLERYWSLPSRAEVAFQLARLGVDLITTPNFSLPANVVRWDNLYNMQRIAVCWEELARAGIPAALHVNARTDRDWERWISFVAERDEVTALSFEFGTGAGHLSRLPWYAQRLCHLAREVGRPLSIVVRGGLAALPMLRRAFDGVVFIDTTSFVKTMQRQRLSLSLRQGVRSCASPTPAGHRLDALLNANVGVMKRVVRDRAAARVADF